MARNYKPGCYKKDSEKHSEFPVNPDISIQVGIR